MKYDVDYFIAKFEAIPEEKWGIGKYENESGQMCAYGHCGCLSGFNMTEEGNHLINLSEFSFVSINDGKNNSYQQTTPKQRVLAALYDLKKV